MAEKNLETLFHDTLKDIYYAERTILKALPKMSRGASRPDLKPAFEKHKDETEVTSSACSRCSNDRQAPQGKTCPAIDGILEEGDEILRSSRARRRSTPA